MLTFDLLFLLNTHNLRRTLLLSTVLLIATHSFAQNSPADASNNPPQKDTTLPKPEFGIKLGIQAQNISGNAWNNSFQTGALGGFFVGLHKNKIGVRAEILAGTSIYKANTKKDASGNPIGLADSVGNLADFKVVTLNIPVLFEYYILPGLSIQAGPQLNSILGVKSMNAFPGAAKTLFKQSEFLGVIGVEKKLPHHILVGARYNYGFSDINNVSVSEYPESWKTQTIQVYAGYRFQ